MLLVVVVVVVFLYLGNLYPKVCISLISDIREKYTLGIIFPSVRNLYPYRFLRFTMSWVMDELYSTQDLLLLKGNLLLMK